MPAQKSTSQVLIFFVAGMVIFLTQSLLSVQDSMSPIMIQIISDVNRDGKVEFDSDEFGKNIWTLARGAIFFNNNDSDQNSKEPDHSDSVVNGNKDLEDLAILKIKRVPDLPENTRISISVDDSSLSRVNIFQKVGDDEYKVVNLSAEGNIHLAQLMNEDLELRIEANSYADRSWSGVTEVTVSVRTPDGKNHFDSVKMKVAPFILLSNLNKGSVLYVREIPGRNEAFIHSLRELVPKAEAELAIVPAQR